MLDLWQPPVGMSLTVALVTAFVLGIVHGITPDEHTWPITFSYAIGSYSHRRGLLAGLTFSAAFAVQRAIGSELAYLALAQWLQQPGLNNVVDLAVALAMVLAGWHILRGGAPVHLHLLPRAPQQSRPSEVPVQLAAIHGFIAGWGVGAFAVILYTVIAPAMPNALVAWLPGFLFGLGTLVVQAAAGAAFGFYSQHLRLPADSGRIVAARVAGRTLLLGGVAFAVAGVLSVLFPGLADAGIETPIHVHNLDTIGLEFVLLVVVLGIGIYSIVVEVAHASRGVDKVRSGSSP